jgi:hypothetical protein
MVGFTLNVVGLVPAPSGLVTSTGPVSAPLETVAWIVSAARIVKVAETPSKVTEVTSERLVPMILTGLPTAPDEVSGR